MEAASKEYLYQLRERLSLYSLDAVELLATHQERWTGLQSALSVLDSSPASSADSVLAVQALRWGVTYRQPRLDGFEGIDTNLIEDPTLRALLVGHRAALGRIAAQQHPIYDSTVREFDQQLRETLSASEYRLYRSIALQAVRGETHSPDSARAVLRAIQRSSRAVNALRNVVDRVYPLEASYTANEVLPAQREALARIDQLLDSDAGRE